MIGIASTTPARTGTPEPGRIARRRRGPCATAAAPARAALGALLGLASLSALAGCGDAGVDSTPAEAVRARIAALAPAANLGHRGEGVNRPDNPWPENSIPSFEAAMAAGADGVELDVELTLDGELVVMHDDTLDRTTTCSGCVSAYTLAAIQSECRLLDGDGVPTDEYPPTLAEVWDALPADALVNVELKVYDEECRTPTSGPVDLARAAVAETLRLGVERRTLFSSFDQVAAVAVKEADPGLYSGYLTVPANPEIIARVADAGLDAIHPFYTIVVPDIDLGYEFGLQVNVWTVNGEFGLNQTLDKGVSTIITDEPGLLAELIAERR